MGRLIPAGTGMEYHRWGEDPEKVLERPELEGLDSECSPEYLVEPEFIKDQTEVGSRGRGQAQRDCEGQARGDSVRRISY